MVYKMMPLEKIVVNQFELLLHPPFLINCALHCSRQRDDLHTIHSNGQQQTEWPDAELKSSLTFQKIPKTLVPICLLAHLYIYARGAL